MNSKLKILSLLASATLCVSLCACAPADGNADVDKDNPDEYVVQTPDELIEKAEEVIGTPSAGESAIPTGATKISDKITITKAGNYYVDSVISGKKITIDCAGVTLYLSGATLSNEKKVIESNYALTLTLLGENTVSNSNALGSNAIDCAGALTVNGSGSLDITSTKNAIKANSISVVGATLDISAQSDGLHAEVDTYDDATSAPVPSYSDGGFVYLKDAEITVDAGSDGIQADTFVYIAGGDVNLTAGGGAPAVADSDTSKNASGKGIKAGPADWGADKTDIEWSNHLINVTGGSITVNSNDDALHADGAVNISGGTVKISTGAKAVHADEAFTMSGGKIEILKCYKGISAKEKSVTGGEITPADYAV